LELAKGLEKKNLWISKYILVDRERPRVVMVNFRSILIWLDVAKCMNVKIVEMLYKDMHAVIVLVCS